jgi:DNA ligase-1
MKVSCWSGCRYSPYLLACYDPDREEYQSVCRVMSGFSDAFYKEVGHLTVKYWGQQYLSTVFKNCSCGQRDCFRKGMIAVLTFLVIINLNKRLHLIQGFFFGWQTKLFFSEGHLLPRKPVYYQTGEECDVWFSTKVVWEITGAGKVLIVSPIPRHWDQTVTQSWTRSTKV